MIYVFLFSGCWRTRVCARIAIEFIAIESGIQSLEGGLLKVQARLTLTQGADPQSNGLAEVMGGEIARVARSLLHLSSRS